MQYGSDAQSLGSKAHAISGRLHKLLQGPNGLKLGFSAFALVVLLMCVFPSNNFQPHARIERLPAGTSSSTYSTRMFC
jgi:hypothetical protein